MTKNFQFFIINILYMILFIFLFPKIHCKGLGGCPTAVADVDNRCLICGYFFIRLVTTVCVSALPHYDNN
jgi:hypothetical protein